MPCAYCADQLKTTVSIDLLQQHTTRLSENLFLPVSFTSQSFVLFFVWYADEWFSRGSKKKSNIFTNYEKAIFVVDCFQYSINQVCLSIHTFHTQKQRQIWALVVFKTVRFKTQLSKEAGGLQARNTTPLRSCSADTAPTRGKDEVPASCDRLTFSIHWAPVIQTAVFLSWNCLNQLRSIAKCESVGTLTTFESTASDETGRRHYHATPVQRARPRDRSRSGKLAAPTETEEHNQTYRGRSFQMRGTADHPPFIREQIGSPSTRSLHHENITIQPCQKVELASRAKWASQTNEWMNDYFL